MLTQIRFSGFGGQGIIRSGHISGKAAALFDGNHATMTQSFGPEARGSACSSQLLVSDAPVLFPYLTRADILVAMSQEACVKYGPQLRDGGFLLYDKDLVKDPHHEDSRLQAFSVSATRIAEELGNRIVANVVMLGFFTAVTGVISAEAMKKALPGSVPERALKMNLEAFEQGHQFGLQQLEEAKPGADPTGPVRGVEAPEE